MSQLNDQLAHIVNLYKVGQTEEARHLFGQIQLQYANYPNVLWVQANISPSKDEKIQALQQLLRVKPTGKLADLARQRLNQLLPPSQDEFDTLPPMISPYPPVYPTQQNPPPTQLPIYPAQPPPYYPPQHPVYPPQMYPQPAYSPYQNPPTSKRRVAKAKTGVLKYRMMLLLAIGLILSTALFPLVRGKFWITETTSNLFGSNSQTYYTSHNLNLVEFWGAEFYLIPDKYLDIYYDRYSDSNQVIIYDSAFIQMANIGLWIVLLGYALPLGLFLIVSPKIFRSYRGFFAIWVVLHLTLMVVILHESVMSVEGGSLFYFAGCLILLFLSFIKMPSPTASLAMRSGTRGAIPPSTIDPAIQSTPPGVHLQHVADEILRKDGWVRLTTSPKGVFYEKHPGVPFFPAIFIAVVFALIGTVFVLIWLAMTKKIHCTMGYNQGLLTIEKDGRLLFVKSVQDVQQFVTGISKGRVGYTIVLVTGVMSMVVNGILLSQLLA